MGEWGNRDLGEWGNGDLKMYIYIQDLITIAALIPRKTAQIINSVLLTLLNISYFIYHLTFIINLFEGLNTQTNFFLPIV